MRRKRHYKKRYKKRGRGIPHVYNNRIYFGKKPQKGSGVVSLLAKLFQKVVGDIVGL